LDRLEPIVSLKLAELEARIEPVADAFLIRRG
jgi:hypothetical protein